MKITNKKMQTQDGPMTRPSGKMSTHSRVLTQKEADELRRKNNAKKKSGK